MTSGPSPEWPMVGRDDEFRQAMAVLDRSAEYQGVALIGDSGVGKSTLARALADTLESNGQTVRFVLGTEAGTTVPLGAFSRSVIVDPTHQPVAMLVAAHKTLEQDDGLVLVVDDAHLLDPLSATLVHQLATSRTARLIVTMRSGEAALDTVTRLLGDRLLRALHIDAFTPEQTGQLARRMLGGTVQSRLVNELHRRSGGNLLLLRGLLVAGPESGVLVNTEDGWHLRGALHPDRELTDLLEFRLRSFTPEERDAVEVLAAAELLDWEILRELCDAQAVGRLERRGTIQLVADGPHTLARLFHPVVGEAAIRLAGVVRTRQLNGLLAQTIQKHLDAGGWRVRTPDVRGRVRVAQLMMHSDLEPDLTVIISAASRAMAMSDLGGAEDLARFAHQRGGGLPAAFVLVDSLIWQGRGDEAEAVLADLELGGADELTTARADCLRAANLFWNLRDVVVARQVLADAGERVASEVAATLVRALDVSFAFFSGDLATTIAAGTTLCTSGVMPIAASWACASTALALALTGRCNDVQRVVGTGPHAEPRSHSGPQRFAIGMAEAMALTAIGDQRSADTICERYAAMAAGVPEADAMVQAIVGLVSTTRGDLPAACSAFRDSISALPRGFPSSWVVLVTAWQAQAEGARGDGAAAAAALRRAEEVYGAQAAVFLPELELARAWARVSTGEVSAGRNHATRAAQFARRSGMWAVELRAQHTAARFGDRSRAPRLAELAETLGTPLAATMSAHGRGLALRDGNLLDAAADRFAAMGALILAADAAAQAAHEHARGGHRKKELASAAHAHRLAGQCGSRTPAVTAAAQPFPITGREREIVMLVAAGLSNRLIADRLSVSVRTVDGHLYRVFTKLGIERREELVRIFDRSRSES